jgi:hypothetical protein
MLALFVLLALTPDESRQAVVIGDALRAASNAKRSLVGQGSCAIKPLAYLIGGSQEATEGLFVLLGTNPANKANPEALQAWERLTRAERVDYAYRSIERGGTRFFLARTALGRCQPAGNFRSADYFIDQAITTIDGLARLPYAQPHTGGVFGPHGSLPLALKDLLYALKYWRDPWAIQETFRAVQRDSGSRFTQYTEGADDIVRAALLLTGAQPLKPGQDRACQVLEAVRLLSMDQPKRFHGADPNGLTDGWREKEEVWEHIFSLPRCK